ncbi:MAG: hypothetical protein A1D16_19215 [Flavihumibacter sp. CACIAM 22H1]|nr:MAG: hypothetical protein A1D16_19215 [Flavihumibacter sp. CACIAM 22H1]
MALAISAITTTQAQTDTSAVIQPEGDTMRIGNIIILKNGQPSNTSRDVNIQLKHRNHNRKNNNSLYWFAFDLGFNNFVDNTDYTSAETQAFAPGATDDWFNLRNSKSINVNIWFVQGRLNMIQHVINLRYGAGLEFYNFRFEEDIRFRKNPPSVYLDDEINYNKNKLAMNYITVPLMLNINFTPRKSLERSFGISAGVSGSYLYASRQKYRSQETGKEKLKGNLGLNDFKLAYIGELHLGPVQVFGSYATESMFKKGLDFTPYTVGLRFSTF